MIPTALRQPERADLGRIVAVSGYRLLLIQASHATEVTGQVSIMSGKTTTLPI
jgi:hypothetical protein